MKEFALAEKRNRAEISSCGRYVTYRGRAFKLGRVKRRAGGRTPLSVKRMKLRLAEMA